MSFQTGQTRLTYELVQPAQSKYPECCSITQRTFTLIEDVRNAILQTDEGPVVGSYTPGTSISSYVTNSFAFSKVIIMKGLNKGQ